jgi:MFS transporter, DHA2 family, multidrug resistance protein
MFTGARRARAIAMWTAVAGMGIVLGPVTGGWLLQRYWQGSVFRVNMSSTTRTDSWEPVSDA